MANTVIPLRPIPQPFGMGAQLSPEDYRDKVAAMGLFVHAALTLPKSLNTDLGSVLNQQQQLACVANSVVYLLRLYWRQKTGKWIDFNPRFLDIMVKSIDGLDRATAGTFARAVLKIAADYGCCTTKTLANDTSVSILKYRDPAAITDVALKEAEQYKIPGFLLIDRDLNSIREALFLYGALTSTFVVGPELWTPSQRARDIEPLRTPQTTMSGHQMTDKGFVDQYNGLLLNSWGKDWADDGAAIYDPVAWGAFTFERWAIATIPEDTKDFLKALPSPQNFHYRWTRDLSRGMKNQDVQMVQVAYMILGLMQPVTPEEFGTFGPRTAAANLAFQQQSGIKIPSADDVGPQTRASLNKRFSL